MLFLLHKTKSLKIPLNVKGKILVENWIQVLKYEFREKKNEKEKV